jgi:hypothetical protein
MLKKSISIITAITFFSGCAVKQEDSTATKALKHTANAPAYVIVGVGMAATLAVQGTLIGAGKLVGAGKKNENSDAKEVDAKENEVKNEQMKETVSIETSDSSNQ